MKKYRYKSRFIGLFFVCFTAVLLSERLLADQNHPKLNHLFEKLKNIENEEDGLNVTTQIWHLWSQNDSMKVNNSFNEGILFLSSLKYESALKSFSTVINLDPSFSEGWNKRATAYYLLNRFEESIEDIKQVLSLEPRHFGALSGLGIILTRQGSLVEAKLAFTKALEINPSLTGVRNIIKELEYSKN